MFTSFLRDSVLLADQTIIWYFLALNSFYALLLALSIPEIWRHWKITRNENLRTYVRSEALPPISIIVPAFNEEATIVNSVLAQLTLEYPQHEVVVVNDGSTDGTMERLRAAFRLYEVPPAFPHRLPTQPVRAFYRSRLHSTLLVIDKENGGKADALNEGISSARYPIVVPVDADTLIAPDALLRLVRPFLLGEHVAAAGGTIRVANGCEVRRGRVAGAHLPPGFLAAVQVPEYLRAFLFGRMGWNRLGGNFIVSGAFGLFQRQYLLAIGGYQVGNVVEDLDLVVRLHAHLHRKKIKYDIPFIPDPVAWTEVPSDVRSHARQRERWHRGLVATMAIHWRMLMNPRYGRIGLVTMPFFFFGEMLAPLVEVLGYVLTAIGIVAGFFSLEFALLFLAVALGYQMLLTIWAVILEEATFHVYPRFRDFMRMLWYAVAEPFGYRQLTVLWRLYGFWNAFRGLTHWGEMRRHGFSET